MRVASSVVSCSATRRRTLSMRAEGTGFAGPGALFSTLADLCWSSMTFSFFEAGGGPLGSGLLTSASDFGSGDCRRLLDVGDAKCGLGDRTGVGIRSTGRIALDEDSSGPGLGGGGDN